MKRDCGSLLASKWITCLMLSALGGGLLLLAPGCSPATPETAEAPIATAAPTSPGESEYLLKSEPAGARAVIEARQAATDGEELLITGRIGGSANPWIEGRAAFSIVDPSLKACSDIPGDDCPAPWDYCCETSELPDATALVKLVDENGQLVQTDARELLPVKELSTVVVQGKAQRDEAGNLTVLASGVFVQQK